MTAIMARIRITIDCEEVYRRAFLARAALEGLSPQELFHRIVAEQFPDDVAHAKAALDSEEQRKPPKRK